MIWITDLCCSFWEVLIYWCHPWCGRLRWLWYGTQSCWRCYGIGQRKLETTLLQWTCILIEYLVIIDVTMHVCIQQLCLYDLKKQQMKASFKKSSKLIWIKWEGRKNRRRLQMMSITIVRASKKGRKRFMNSSMNNPTMPLIKVTYMSTTRL